MHSEARIREIVELREEITKKISGYEKEIEFLRRNMEILDQLTEESSFTKASDMLSGMDCHTGEPPETKKEDGPAVMQAGSVQDLPSPVARPIRAGADGPVVANAYVTPDQISIVLNGDVAVRAEASPLKSFFVERIIGEMKRSDEKKIAEGSLKEAAIDVSISGQDAGVESIVVKNYRREERVEEIIDAAGWTIARMIDGSGG